MTTIAKISYSEFANMCEELTILPGIALENDDVASAIKARDRQLLRAVLETQF